MEEVRVPALTQAVALPADPHRRWGNRSTTADLVDCPTAGAAVSCRKSPSRGGSRTVESRDRQDEGASRPQCNNWPFWAV